MGYEIPVFTDSTKNAAVDLSAKQYQFVKETATGIDLVSAATDKPAGILQNTPLAGESALVMKLGLSKCVYAGAVTVGDSVGPDATGKADTKVLGTDATEFVGGTAQETGVLDDIGTVAVDCMAPSRAV